MKTPEITIHIRADVPVEEAENALAKFAEWVGRNRYDFTESADGKIILWSEKAWNVGYAEVKHEE
jgi:hypothetical protein